MSMLLYLDVSMVSVTHVDIISRVVMSGFVFVGLFMVLVVL